MARKIETMSPFAPADYVLRELGMPEIDNALQAVSPKRVNRLMGVPTPHELSQQALAQFREDQRKFARGDIPEPPDPAELLG